MRYVILAFAGLVAAITWINTSSEGAKIRHEMLRTPNQTTSLY